MYLGLDVGGTHTDAVLIQDGSVISSSKTVTDHGNLISSVRRALDEVTSGIHRSDITKVNLSTTLSTNAIVQGKTEPVGVVVSSGPGISPSVFAVGDNYHILDGSIDHRGSVVKNLDEKALAAVVKKMKSLRLFAAVTKFSTRNPDQENHIASAIGPCDFITLGHSLSGQLNFPRRINTAYFNSTVWRVYNAFADAIEKSIRELEITSPVCILKADGGTIPLQMSRKFPVETILSGPAASVMGIVGLCDISEDSIILDIGGTTTDIAIFASGHPLIERQGITIDAKPTLVRSIETRSIGVGGDSVITFRDGKVMTGPERRGPCMAEGGESPALIDAMNVLGHVAHGDVEKSRHGIDNLARTCGITSAELAGAALNDALESILRAVAGMLDELNSKPVYTIQEMIHGTVISPERVYLMGGPALGFKTLLADRFKLPVEVPESYQIANAIGAALARTTFSAELFADTLRGMCVIPALGTGHGIDQRYTLNDAKVEARRELCRYMAQHNVDVVEDDIDITESSEFRMLAGDYSSGKDIRVRCQLRPGVTMSMKCGQRGI